MTEREWLSCADPMLMVSDPVFLTCWDSVPRTEMTVSLRKRHLCCVAWLRTVWSSLVSEHSRSCVEIAERYLEGGATAMELDEALWMAKDAGEDASVSTEAQIWATAAVNELGGLTESLQWLVLGSDEEGKKLLADTLRDIFGNPFRPVTLDPSWHTPTVVALAEAIYSDRAFDRIPVLADALEEAGCSSPDALSHCRGDGPHVRGCWVVDLLLGKS